MFNSWLICYRRRHPGLVADRALQRMHVTLTRDQVRASPAYQDVASIHRDYEVQLHANYLRSGYWL